MLFVENSISDSESVRKSLRVGKRTAKRRLADAIEEEKHSNSCENCSHVVLVDLQAAIAASRHDSDQQTASFGISADHLLIPQCQSDSESAAGSPNSHNGDVRVHTSCNFIVSFCH